MRSIYEVCYIIIHKLIRKHLNVLLLIMGSERQKVVKQSLDEGCKMFFAVVIIFWFT